MAPINVLKTSPSLSVCGHRWSTVGSGQGEWGLVYWGSELVKGGWLGWWGQQFVWPQRNPA